MCAKIILLVHVSSFGHYVGLVNRSTVKRSLSSLKNITLKTLTSSKWTLKELNTSFFPLSKIGFLNKRHVGSFMLCDFNPLHVFHKYTQKKPTIWLSIHKWNFGPDGERAILDVLKLYKRVYEGHQTPVNIGQYTLCNFCTILATDLDVAIYNE